MCVCMCVCVCVQGTWMLQEGLTLKQSMILLVSKFAIQQIILTNCSVASNSLKQFMQQKSLSALKILTITFYRPESFRLCSSYL